MSNNSNYLFFSKTRCDHSKRCVISLQKSGLIDDFVLCDIDNPQLMIPNFITKVPTLYLSNHQKILCDNDLFRWLEQYIQEMSVKNNVVNNISMSEITGDNTISAYTQSELGSKNGPNYAFINEDENDNIASRFEMLDGSNIKNLSMPSFTRINGNDSNSINSIETRATDIRKSELDKAYEKLLNSREMENRPIARV